MQRGGKKHRKIKKVKLETSAAVHNLILLTYPQSGLIKLVSFGYLLVDIL